MIKSNIGERTVVISGCFVGNEGDSFDLFPIPNEPDYLVSIEVRFSDSSNTLSEAISNGSRIIFEGPFRKDLSFGTKRPIEFASNPDLTFYISLAAGFIGDKDSHYTLLLYYTITSLGKK